jgi:RNA polymerase sigma-70 factor (ECF subfamily)
VDARRAAENAARNAYARLIAFLAARTRDVPAAEDALADAFLAALETWPRSGVPDHPEAWLLTTARRRSTDASRHRRVEERSAPALRAAIREASGMAGREPAEFPDERLALMFVCAHPAIDAGARTPLMLQVVLGLDAARIASAFLVKPAAMGQRLSRAKAKIRDAGIAFQVPPPNMLAPRLHEVLSAAYAAYGSGWEDVAGADERRRGLALEAIELGHLLVRLLPDEPEARGLLALMLHCEARRAARRDATGAYVELSRQDVRLWSSTMAREAEEHLGAAATKNRPGRFQLEAAIQSVHALRLHTGRTEWPALEALYEGLVRLAPSIGAQVGRAAVVAQRDAGAAWALLQAPPAAALREYQPYWALAGRLLAQFGRIDEARGAYERAMGLTSDPSVREYLARQASSLGPGRSP